VEKAEGYIVDFSFLGGLGSQKFAHRVNVGLLASNKEDDRVRSAIYSTARRPFWIYYYMLSFVYLFQFSSVYCVVYIQYTQDDDRHVYLFFIFIIPMAVAFELGATRQVLRHFLGPALHHSA
jgi:hypothetical protein